jgi:predicted dehydrogenase
MSAEAPLRIGLLGAARIAPGALIEPARQRRDIRLVSVAARDPLRARAFAEQNGVENASAGYAELIDRDDIDLVYIALPPDRHCEWTIAALEAGKSVLCEKPFAMNAGEALRMVEAADRSTGALIEAFHYRFHRLMRQAMAVMRDGTIGAPVRASAVVEYPIPTREGEPRWSADHGGGAMMDLGCYGVHALRALLGGEPEVLSARSRRERGVDAATEARLLFPGGVDAELRAAMDPSAPFTEIILEGEQGRLQISGFVLPQRAGRLRLTVGGETRDLPIDGPSSYAAQLDHVAAVVRGAERPITGGSDAIANMDVLDRIRACAQV